MFQLTPLASHTCHTSSNPQPWFGEVDSALFLLYRQLSLPLPIAFFFLEPDLSLFLLMPLEAGVSCQFISCKWTVYLSRTNAKIQNSLADSPCLLFKTMLIFCYIPYPELLSLIETHCHFIVDPLGLCHITEELASRFVLSQCPPMATLVQVKI